MVAAPMTARVILTDIEGTTTPIAFVHEVLFPYARARLPEWVRDRASHPEVAPELQAVRDAAPGVDPLTTLLAWMDRDEKATPLKALQGLIWRDGYEGGAIEAVLYPDVGPALRAWHLAGLRLAVYSSGSEAAQRLIFCHSDAGDLSPLITAYFDTRIGAKRNPDSYRRIAAALAANPPDILFLSDVEAELDAAGSAGLQTCQLLRPSDCTIPSLRHPTVQDFAELVMRTPAVQRP